MNLIKGILSLIFGAISGLLLSLVISVGVSFAVGIFLGILNLLSIDDNLPVFSAIVALLSSALVLMLILKFDPTLSESRRRAFIVVVVGSILGALLAFLVSRDFVAAYAPLNRVLYDALAITRGALRGTAVIGAIAGAIVGLRHNMFKEKGIEMSAIFDKDYRF